VSRLGTATDWPLGIEAYLDKYDVVAARGSINLDSDTDVHILLLRNDDEGPKSPLVLVAEQTTAAADTVADSLAETAHKLLFDWYVEYDSDYLWGLVDEIDKKALRREYLYEAFTWFVWTLDPENPQTIPLLLDVKEKLQ
jgi:predicted nucleotidyltransferase